jgi:hypothetical protein
LYEEVLADSDLHATQYTALQVRLGRAEAEALKKASYLAANKLAAG